MIQRGHENITRENNFNLLRILAASAVLISHAYPLALGQGAPEPLDQMLGMSLGTLAVLTFFAISGYFISQSFHNKPSIIDFGVARVLRIYPGLVAVLLLTIFVLGPVFTKADLSAYFADWGTLLYLPRNIRLWPLQYELPGVFGDNPFPGAINGSLWTLAYEVACYAMVVLVGLAGLARSQPRFGLFLIGYSVFYVAAIPLVRGNYDHLGTLRNVHLLTLPFVIGMSLFHFRERVPLRLSVLAALCAASVLAFKSPWFHELFVVTWSYGILYVGFLRYEPLLAYNQLGDYSYGTYIYAFPVEQIVAALYNGCTPFLMMFLSLPLTYLFAVLSWHLLEERALSQRSAVTALLRRRVASLSLGSSR
jgi:peptidoglycan/LPS O-acetylase OafA/YrhL